PTTSEIYTLSLHDALPICGLEGPVGRAAEDFVHGDPESFQRGTHGAGIAASGSIELSLAAGVVGIGGGRIRRPARRIGMAHHDEDRKSTRLNSSHVKISYA